MGITVTATALPEVKLIEPQAFGDARGFFVETFNARDFAQHVQAGVEFVQDNHSRSAQYVLRGMHYQIRHPQGKLVRVTAGAVFDVAVDVRTHSPDFGKWTGALLSAENRRQMWIPPGFAHGFLVLSSFADFLYKTTDYWYPEHERSLRWDDPEVAIAWPRIDGVPKLAAKDAQAPRLAQLEALA